MNRGVVAGAVVGVLALVTTLLVVLALRPPDAEAPPVAPFEMGAVAASGDTVWRWVGPVNCNADADVLQMERSVGGAPWETSPTPLSNVYSLSFADEDLGIATGTTRSCARGVVATNDGGRTWRAWVDNPVLLDAWFQGNTIWGIERVIGQLRIGAYRLDSQARVRPIESIKPTQPCDAGDGVPDQIGFWDDEVGLLFCENDVVGSRLVARTTNQGVNFERLADARPTTGLDGGGSVLDMDFAGTETVWLQLTEDPACAEGQLRVSDSQGAVFDRVACPSDSVRIDKMLDAAFTSEQDGVMLGLVDREPVMFVTDDGGASWSCRADAAASVGLAATPGGDHQQEAGTEQGHGHQNGRSDLATGARQAATEERDASTGVGIVARVVVVDRHDVVVLCRDGDVSGEGELFTGVGSARHRDSVHAQDGERHVGGCHTLAVGGRAARTDGVTVDAHVDIDRGVGCEGLRGERDRAVDRRGVLLGADPVEDRRVVRVGVGRGHPHRHRQDSGDSHKGHAATQCLGAEHPAPPSCDRPEAAAPST